MKLGKKYSSFADECPNLLKEWHQRNIINPYDVSACSGVAVWWICSNGHEWKTKISSRFNGRGCSQCLKRPLITFNAKLTKWWNADKNEISINDISVSSGKKVWWICEKNHEWQATVASLNRDNAHCPYCYGRKVCLDNCLATVNPELSNQWNKNKNGDLTPYDLTAGSKRQVWWQCQKNHEWMATVKDRKKNNCPFCSGRIATQDNNLAVYFPELIEEWHYVKNSKLPEQYTSSSAERVWWKCSKNELHEWEGIISNRSKAKTGCPFCSHKFPDKDTCLGNVASDELLREWHPSKNTLTPNDILPFSNTKVWWQCSSNTAHEWEACAHNRYGLNTGCPFCCQNHTFLEKEFEKLFNVSLFNKKALVNYSYRPDFKLNDNVYVNVDGLYWHNEENKGKDYHFKMRENFNSENKKILQFYEDEVYNKSLIVKSIIDNKIGKTTKKIFARKCILKEINGIIAKDFLQTNHLMGFSSFGKHLGLFHNNDLVAVLSYRFLKKKQIVEIVRFAGKLDLIITGGFGKMVSYLEKSSLKNNITTMISFCDLRYSSGISYDRLGFVLEKITQGWCWSDNIKRYNRLRCRAYKDNNGYHITEAERAKQLKLFKIYDAGQAKYVKKIGQIESI